MGVGEFVYRGHQESRTGVSTEGDMDCLFGRISTLVVVRLVPFEPGDPPREVTRSTP